MPRDDAHDRLRRSVGGRIDDVVVLIRRTAELASLLPQIAPGEVVVLEAGGRSRAVTADARSVVATRSIDETITLLEAELVRAPAALVVVEAVSAATGEVLPIGRLAAAAHRHDARILVDAARLLPHRAVSLTSWGIDYALISSRVLDVPFDVTALIGRADWLAASDRATPTTPTAVAVDAFASAVDQLATIGFEQLGYREYALHKRLDAGLGRLPGVRSLSAFDDPLDRVGMVALAVDGREADDVVRQLTVRHGIAGCDSGPVTPGRTGRAVRFQVGLGTTFDDVDRLLRALGGSAVAAA